MTYTLLILAKFHPRVEEHRVAADFVFEFVRQVLVEDVLLGFIDMKVMRASLGGLVNHLQV